MNEETRTDIVNWQLCRICAEENYDIIHIYDEVGISMQLEEKINHYLPITVSEEDCLPLYMCISCIKKLNTTHELIVSCIESNDKFNKLLKLEVKSEVSEEQPEVTGSILGLNEVIVESFQQEDLNCLDNKETCERNVVSKLDVDVVQVIQEQESSQAAELTFGEPHTIRVIDNKPQKDWVLIKFDSPPNESSKKEVDEVLESVTHNETGSTSFLCNQFLVQEGVEQLRESYNGTAEIEESCIETSHRKEVLENVNNINNEPDKVNGFVKEPSRHCGNSEYLNNKLNQNIEREAIILQKPININSEDTEEEILLSCDNEVNVTIENTPSDSNKHFLDKFHSDKNWGLNNTQILQFVSQGHEVNGNNKPETILILNSLKENENLSDVDNYICGVCNVKHSNEAELKVHVCIKTDNEENVNILSCEYCHNIFEDVNALNNHMQVHRHFISRQDDTIKHLTEQECTNQQSNYTSESRPWLCDHCGKRFTHIKNLRVHKRNHLDDSFKKRHKCEVCGKSFRSRFLVRDHMMIHTGERPFLCDRCPKRFTTKMRLKQHTNIHEGIRPFQCSLCSFNSMRRANLVKHYKTHVAFECSICHVYFVSAVSLFNHRRTHSEEELQHSGETRNSDETAVASNFQCSDCGKFLSSKASLEIHRRVHAGIKPFVCVECGKCFNQKPALNYHRRLHTGERPHSCQFCGRGFNSKVGKDNHERVHTGEKPYHCSKCGAGFRCSANLRQHELIHEDVRAFPCLHCEKRFRRREAMQIHMRIHTGERPYSCPICHRTFTQKGDMKKHVRSHSSRTEKHVVCSNCGVRFINKKQWKLHACEMTIDKNQGTVAIKPEDEVLVREITVVSNDIQEYEEEYQS